MPPKRSARATSGRGASQGTLTFGGQHRVTKPTASPPRSHKTKQNDPAVLEASLSTTTDPPAHDSVAPTPAKAQPAAAAAAADPLTTSPSTVTDVLGGRSTPEPTSEQEQPGEQKSAAEYEDEDEGADTRLAQRVPVTQIKSYWHAKEEARVAPRVHQQDLSLGEKILREWDMSGQYGPCIGIGRERRWRRARRLGLDPPVEVLAVLMGRLDGEEGKKAGGRKQGKVGDGGNLMGEKVEQRAYVDLLMGNRYEVAV